MMCAVYWALSMQQGFLALLSVLYILLTLAGSGASGMVYGRVVTSWFSRSRGTALAVSRIGPAVLGSIMPLLLYSVIEAHGWRAGYQLLAAVTVTLGLPAILWLVREPYPSTEASEAPAITPAARASAGPKVGLATLLEDPNLWWLATVAFLLSFPLLGFSLHLQPFLMSHQLSGSAAAKVLGAFSATILVGTLVSGTLMDRCGPRLVGTIFLGCAIVGFTALTTFARGPAGASCAVLLIGLNQGLEYDLLSFVIARQFGRRGFAPTYGVMVVVTALAGTLGATGFGALRDRTGSYDSALWLGSACLLGAVSILLSYKGFRALQAPRTPQGGAMRRAKSTGVCGS
jgi:predicted MFS family arabinose efflux permease